MPERFPAKPYIKDEYPKNVTTLVNSTVKFECPQVIPDLQPFIEWFYSETFIFFGKEFNKSELNNRKKMEVSS